MVAVAWETAPAQDPGELARLHAPLVRRIALHLASRLPAGVELDDLLQSGMCGLLEAAQSYQADSQASFETFAGYRIRGAMLDELRRGDWSPRSVHRESRRLAQTRQSLEQSLGRPPTIRELAQAMDMSQAQVQQLESDGARCQLLTLDADADEDGASSQTRNLRSPDASPDQLIVEQQSKEQLAEAIGELPERDQLVLSLYYREELHQREIAEVLSVTESRVSQLHSRALKRLREILQVEASGRRTPKRGRANTSTEVSYS